MQKVVKIIEIDPDLSILMRREKMVQRDRTKLTHKPSYLLSRVREVSVVEAVGMYHFTWLGVVEFNQASANTICSDLRNDSNNFGNITLLS